MKRNGSCLRCRHVVTLPRWRETKKPAIVQSSRPWISDESETGRITPTRRIDIQFRLGPGGVLATPMNVA